MSKVSDTGTFANRKQLSRSGRNASIGTGLYGISITPSSTLWIIHSGWIWRGLRVDGQGCCDRRRLFLGRRISGTVSYGLDNTICETRAHPKIYSHTPFLTKSRAH